MPHDSMWWVKWFRNGNDNQLFGTICQPGTILNFFAWKPDYKKGLQNNSGPMLSMLQLAFLSGKRKVDDAEQQATSALSSAQTNPILCLNEALLIDEIVLFIGISKLTKSTYSTVTQKTEELPNKNENIPLNNIIAELKLN